MEWKFFMMYNLNTDEIEEVQVPFGASEILIFAGFPNHEADNQIYGGKSYIIPALGSHWNIVYEHEFYDASALGPKCGKFYAFWNSEYILKLQTLNFPTVRVRIYYK